MTASQGAIGLAEIEDMTFHELVAWWLEVQQLQRMSK